MANDTPKRKKKRTYGASVLQAVSTGREARRALRNQVPPWNIIPLVSSPWLQFRMDIDWYKIPIENLFFVQTRYYHPRWRNDYQVLDALLMLEFSFRDALLDLESPVSWYWYLLRPLQVHHRVRYLRYLIRRGFWSSGALELYTPDGSGYLIRRDCIVEYSYEPYPYDDDYDFVCLWLSKIQRVVSFVAPKASRPVWESALEAREPQIVYCDLFDPRSWEIYNNRKNNAF